MKARSVRGDAAKERRSKDGRRVEFEAMVAIGGDEGAGAFEAESVDVSNGGMRLRTAYLPQVGAQLVFRFDGPDGEIVAQAEVIWANEEARGGEFAVKFIDVDDETMEALRTLTAPEPGEEHEPAAEPKPNLRGTRVKLHIEGLASPMKARIKDGDDAEICVGSSLEFLKLGRHVEVEDVDHGDRKEGFVDGVKVEIDPSTSVPQLVVSLRFDGAVVGAPIMAAPAQKRVTASAEEAAPSAAKKADDAEAAPVTKVTGGESKRATVAKSEVAAATATEDDD
ncbi:MAG TPA: PilZ domain-containing protein, partial [Polyangiaceae bacterium]|nr:PilZ domain-containing protein [Polyangiaceae bacterium]